MECVSVCGRGDGGAAPPALHTPEDADGAAERQERVQQLILLLLLLGVGEWRNMSVCLSVC